MRKKTVEYFYVYIQAFLYYYKNAIKYKMLKYDANHSDTASPNQTITQG